MESNTCSYQNITNVKKPILLKVIYRFISNSVKIAEDFSRI